MENKIKKSRSSGYPVWPLGECIEAIRLVKQNLGESWASRESIVNAMGYSGVTGSSGTKVSACVHFGLLKRSGNTYALSELSEKILVPISETEKTAAIIEAVKSPNLYSKLIEAYNGKALPNMLDNILSREYGIISTSSKRATEIFKKSLEYAGIFHNGIITEITPDTSNSESSFDSAPISQKINNSTSLCGRTTIAVDKAQFPSADTAVFTINLSNTGAKLLIPNEFSYSVSIGALAKEVQALSDKLQEINKSIKENEHGTKTES